MACAGSSRKDDERSDRALLHVTICRYAGVDVCPILHVSSGTASLYVTRCSNGSQCSFSNSGLACDRLGAWSRSTILVCIVLHPLILYGARWSAVEHNVNVNRKMFNVAKIAYAIA